MALVLVGGIIATKYIDPAGNNSANTDSSDESEAMPRHLILISIDTLRADYLGCYGKEGANTPNIDALAKGGIVFERHHSNYPLTLPAHLTQLTGVSSLGHRVRDNLYHRLPNGITTLPEVLKKHDFKTGAFVSAHTMKSGSGIERGFDVYDDEDVVLPEKGKLTIAERDAETTLKLAGDWLASTGGDRAFCFIHLFDPHAPYQPQAIAGTTSDSSTNQRYAGEISYVDQQIGVFLDRLRKIEMLENTLVVITSDHGEGLGEHDELTHGYFCYDTTTHVPLIISGGSDIKAGTKVSSIVRNYDLAPTLVELLGISSDKIKAQTHGISLLPLINQPDKDLGLSAYVESHYAYLNANWAKIRGLRTDKGLTLFSGLEQLYVTGKSQLDENLNAPEIDSARKEIERLMSSLLPPPDSKSDIREAVTGSPYPGESPAEQNFKPESLSDSKDLPSPHSMAGVLMEYQEAELAYDAQKFFVCIAMLEKLTIANPDFLMAHKFLATARQAAVPEAESIEQAKGLTRGAIAALLNAEKILIANKQDMAVQAVRINLALLYARLNDVELLTELAKADRPRISWMLLLSKYRTAQDDTTRANVAASFELFLSRDTLKKSSAKQAGAHLELMKENQPIKLATWE